MNERPETTGDDDVVALLMRQHEQIRSLFSEMEQVPGTERQAAFDRLRRYLAVHETAEEEVVHPTARHADGAAAEQMVDARLSEENEAKQMLERLEALQMDDPQFAVQFHALKTSVTEHAEHEEREEFPRLREHTSAEQSRRMATAVKAAEALAPTHPHAGVESAGMNVLAGPFAAMIDRVRDVLQGATGTQKKGGGG